MTIEYNDIKNHIEDFSLVTSYETIKNGMMRIQTPFQYMDGSYIDLFLGTTGICRTLTITDLGQTVANLLDVHIKISTTKKRKEKVDSICKSLQVLQDKGEFKVYLDNMNELSSAIVRLSQACIRIADMAFDQRYRSNFVLFKDEVEEIIALTDLEYDASPSINGSYGKDIVLDYKVYGKKVNSLIQTLSTANAAAAQQIRYEVFTKWFEVKNHKEEYQFLTFYDSRNNIFRHEDLAIIQEYSTVFAFPDQQDQIKEALAA